MLRTIGLASETKVGSADVGRILVSFVYVDFVIKSSQLLIMLNWLFFIALVTCFTQHLCKDNTSVL